MMFTQEERRLLVLYYSGSVTDTVDTLRYALRTNYDPHERNVIFGILRKVKEAGTEAAANFSEFEGLNE